MSGWSQDGNQFETNDDLLWPRSVQTFTRMARDDSRLSSILQAISLPIRLTSWRIDACGASDEVTKHVADDLGLPIVGEDETYAHRRSKGRFSWGSHLQQALTYLQFGHSIFETIYRVDNGRVHLAKLAPRPQSTIAWWNVARDGGLRIGEFGRCSHEHAAGSEVDHLAPRHGAVPAAVAQQAHQAATWRREADGAMAGVA
jgi:hypothetical protein